MQFPPVNFFPNDENHKAWYAVFAVFILWWVFLLLSSLFGGLLRRRTPVAANNNVPPAAAVGPAPPVAPVRSSHDTATHRICDALRDIFISALAVTVFNHLVNGITRSFNILIWVAVAIGVVWALLRGPFRRFADILQLAIIPLFITLWIFGFKHARFLGNEVD